MPPALQRRIDIVEKRDPVLSQVLQQYAQAMNDLANAHDPGMARVAQKHLGDANSCGRAVAGLDIFTMERQALLEILAADPAQAQAFEAAQALISGHSSDSPVSFVVDAGLKACRSTPSGTVKALPFVWRGCAVATRYKVTALHTMIDGNLEVIGQFELDGHNDIAFILASKAKGTKAMPRIGEYRCSASD